ncbi:MAG: hypothetical protein A4S08_12755 [Proteobacteria bacterium SG_bin4]|nr:MAG: hypothetical protein A4S08_12755 [Proteobacteria bacterium SG_bin4]
MSEIESFEKQMDRLASTTKSSFIFIIPAILYSVDSKFDIGSFEGGISLGGYPLTPLAAVYVILFVTCLITSILVAQLYKLKSSIAKIEGEMEKAESIIRDHQWWVNPFAQMASDAPNLLRYFYDFLRPTLFLAYLVILHAPVFMLSNIDGVNSIVSYTLLVWFGFIWWFAYMGVEEVEKAIRKCETKDLTMLNLAGTVVFLSSAYFAFSYVFDKG